MLRYGARDPLAGDGLHPVPPLVGCVLYTDGVTHTDGVTEAYRWRDAGLNPRGGCYPWPAGSPNWPQPAGGIHQGLLEQSREDLPATPVDHGHLPTFQPAAHRMRQVA